MSSVFRVRIELHLKFEMAATMAIRNTALHGGFGGVGIFELGGDVTKVPDDVR